LCSASAADFQWLSTAGGSGADVGRQIVVDDVGSSYVIGSFNSSTCPFGNIILTNSSQSVSATFDVFVVKYDTTGSVVWAQKFGGSSNDRGYGIAPDASHQCYITGSIESTNFSIGNVTLTNYAPYGNSSLFVAKLDATGKVLWAQSPRSSLRAGGVGIVVDSVGNSYVAGTFTGTNNFGSTNLVSSPNYSDALLLKYDPDGTLLWAQKAGGDDVDSAAGLALDTADNLYLLANIRSTNAVFGTNVFSAKGTNTCQNVVVAKYNPSGNVLWAKLYGGTDVDAGADIAIGPNTNCYITGTIRSTNMVVGGTTLSDSGTTFSGDIFVAHLNSSGDPVAAWTVKGHDTDGSWSIAVDQFGDCYVAGFFQSTNLLFNSGWLGSVTLTNSELDVPGRDAFVAEFDGYGNVMHTFQPTGVQDQRAFSIALDKTATPYVMGWTTGTNVLFGSFATTNAYLDLFVTKLDPNFPVLRIEDGDQAPVMPSPGKVLVSWPLNQTGSDAANVEISTNLVNWSDPSGYVVSLLGGGRRWLDFEKLATPMYYRLRFGN
jgi:hypothetical protein